MSDNLIETLKDDDGWVYDIFKTNTPAEEIDPFQSFITLWNSKRKSGALPAWRDFELKDFAEWYGYIIVQDIVYDSPPIVVYRLWGTKVAELFDCDVTGKPMQTAGNLYISQTEQDLIVRHIEEAVIVRSGGTIAWQNREFKTVQLMEMLLADDGQNVDKIIGLVREL